MTYKDALAYLNGFICYERTAGWKYGPGTFNLSRFHSLLDDLGRPQHAYPTIHLAGSDGKGSTAAMLVSILRQAGYRVGLYTSPHLEDIRERIIVNGEWIAKDAFAAQIPRIQAAIGDRDDFPRSFATFFELLTAVAFLHFRESQVDVAVIETGLGGRLDATNVLHPDLTCVTHLSLEHTETLGDTLEAIASEKLDICRPGVPAVIAHQKPEIMPFVTEWLRDRSIPMYATGARFHVASSVCDGRMRTLRVEDTESEDWNIRLPLLGHYQVDNALTALLAASLLPRFSGSFSREEWREIVLRGLENAFWPGRYETLEVFDASGGARVVLDGAHSARGARTLRETLDEVENGGPRTLLLGFLRGKKIYDMCRELIRPEDNVILTKAPTPRGVTTEEIFSAMPEKENPFRENALHLIESPANALGYGLAACKKSGQTLVIAGSLYLVGLCRSELRKDHTLKNGRHIAA